MPTKESTETPGFTVSPCFEAVEKVREAKKRVTSPLRAALAGACRSATDAKHRLLARRLRCRANARRRGELHSLTDATDFFQNKFPGSCSSPFRPFGPPPLKGRQESASFGVYRQAEAAVFRMKTAALFFARCMHLLCRKAHRLIPYGERFKRQISKRGAN